MVAVEGPEHIVSYLNPAFSKLIGLPKKEITGRPFGEIVAHNEGNESRLLLDRVFRSGIPEIIVEQKHTHSSLAYWTYSMWPIIGEEGLAAGVMIQVTDVTGAAIFRKQMTEMNQALALSGMRQHELTEAGEKLNALLKAATDAKSLFLANMSHEIRTPLGAIMGYSELLCDESFSNEEKLDFIDTISRNGKELTRIIDDILDLSKVEAGCLDVERRVISLPDVITDMTNSLLVKARGQATRLSVVSEGKIPETILTDPTRLRQILMNIVGNALKFTRDGEVKVTVKLLPAEADQESKVAFIVADTGCGISVEGQTKLFLHFSQADNSTTRLFGGTGLGLILSQNLARALGGDIVLQSSKVDEGSVFLVTIEAGKFDENRLLSDMGGREKRESRASQVSAVWKSTELAGMHVLLVEDAEDTRLMIRHFLLRNGATVDIAQNGIEAVDRALSMHYDIVLMDIQMPFLDGYGAMEQLRLKNYEQPVIALTAHALTEERRKTRKAGFCDHITKPVDLKHLVNVMK